MPVIAPPQHSTPINQIVFFVPFLYTLNNTNKQFISISEMIKMDKKLSINMKMTVSHPTFHHVSTPHPPIRTFYLVVKTDSRMYNQNS